MRSSIDFVSLSHSSFLICRAIRRIATCYSHLFRVSAATVLVFVSSAAHSQVSNQVGLWFKPSEPGWGVSMQQQGIRTFAVWFTYDQDRKPTWYSLNCTLVKTLCHGDLYSGRGLPFSKITGGADAANIKSGVGTLRLQNNAKQIDLSYTVGSVTQTKTGLEPLIFAPEVDVPVCNLQSGGRSAEKNYTDMWWGGSENAGWGLQISHQGSRVFFGWYTYNDQGAATWNTGSGLVDANNPNRFSGELFQIPVGVAFSGLFTNTQPSTISLGNFTLDFSSGEAGTFTYTLSSYGVANRSLPLMRFAIAGGTTNLCVTRAGPPTLLAQGDITPNGLAPTCTTNTPITLDYVAGAGPAQKLDLYLPRANATPSAPYPLVIWIHGGGWILGDKADVGSVKRLVCRGYAVASINYRLSGGAKFPAQIFDIKTAIRFLRANASGYNLDANRFAAFGSSAGGHLASLAATSGDVPDLEGVGQGNGAVSSRVQAAVAWFGPSDFAQMDAQARAQGCSPGAANHGSSGSPESNLIACTVDDPACATAVERANPAAYVNASAPPMLLMHGSRDCTVPNAQSAIVKQAMDGAGRCAVKRNVLGAGHGGPAWDSVAVQDAVASFLDAVLSPSVPFACTDATR
jgi:acetyl esterase/lipase